MAKKESVNVVKMVGKHSAKCTRAEAPYNWTMAQGDGAETVAYRDRYGNPSGYAYKFYRFKCAGCGTASMLVSADVIDRLGAAIEVPGLTWGSVEIL